MGIGTGIFVFLRPSQHGGKDRMGRPGSREKEIGFEKERKREREKERKREREIPDFPKPPAPALWFGSMNPISKVLGPWEHRGKLQRRESRLVSGQKL